MRTRPAVWRVAAFRAYAAHMRTEEFRDGLAVLLDRMDQAQTASTWLLRRRRLSRGSSTTTAEHQ